MKYLKIFILVAISFVLTNCEKDADLKPKEYPFLITNTPTVRENEVVFSASVTNTGNQKILKYGFVWSDGPTPTKLDEHKILNNPTNNGTFDITVNFGLTEGKIYNVRSYVLTDKFEIYGNIKPFTSRGSLAPVIKDFYPKFGPIGTKVTIEGENFATTTNGNIISFGNTFAKVDSATENKLFVTVPKVTESKTTDISIQTAGKEAISSTTFDIWFPWKRKNNINLLGYNAVSFSIGNVGYLINTFSYSILKYDPLTDDWQSNIILPESSGAKPFVFTLNGNIYVILEKNFWAYDPLQNTWTRKSDFPNIVKKNYSTVFGMTIGNKLYIGDCYNAYEFWEYNPSSDIWQRKADFIGNYQANQIVGKCAFALNSKGYLVVSQDSYTYSTVWQYDPIQDKWYKKSPLQSVRFYNCIANNVFETAIIFLNNLLESATLKVAKYNELNDSWVWCHDCPQLATLTTGFSINNKCYLSLNYSEFYNNKYALWEFDLSKN